MTITTAPEQNSTTLLAESPMTSAEKQERTKSELAIQLAGKERTEKLLIICEEISRHFSEHLYRGDEGNQSWETWCQIVLPTLLPNECPRNVEWANARRNLYEARAVLALSGVTESDLPVRVSLVEPIKSLIPRTNLTRNQPADLVNKDRGKGLALVWGKALKVAHERGAAQPFAKEVQSALRQSETQLKVAGVTRREFSGQRYSKPSTVDVTATSTSTPPQPQQPSRSTQPTNIGPSREEIAQRQKVAAVKEQLQRQEKVDAEEIEKWYIDYSNALYNASTSLKALRRTLQSIAVQKGTQYLSELRRCPGTLGINTVSQDLETIKGCGELLVEIATFAQSSEGPLVANPETVDAEVQTVATEVV